MEVETASKVYLLTRMKRATNDWQNSLFFGNAAKGLRQMTKNKKWKLFPVFLISKISTQICDTSLHTELYTESKYISTYFFQSSTHSWKTLFNEFLFLLVQFLFLRTVQFQYHFKIQRIDNLKTIFQICPTEFYRDISYILVQWEIISHLLQNFTQ